MSQSARIRFTTLLLSLTLFPMVAGTAGELPPGGTFTDDDGSVFEPSIEAVAAVGITKGCNPPHNDRFCPSAFVTRGQMAAFLVRALGLTADAGGNRFVDDDESIFEADIEKLAHAGITKGCNPPHNDRFCPGANVTRGQMAAFLVRAYGYADPGSGNHFVDDDGSVFEADIDLLYVSGVTKGCNPPHNDRFCPSAFVTRGQMAAFLQRAEGLDPIVPPPPAVPTLTVVATGLASPVHVTAPAGDDRLFIVEQGGVIRILQDGVVKAAPFLDIGAKVLSGGERGLLSMAFHPDYATNGRFFVYYSSDDIPANCPSVGCHTSVVAEYRVSGDPNVALSGESVIIEIGQPYSNHNGGMIEFGPDGHLYIGLGDGGSGNDPQRNAQDIGNLLGAMLRLDVDGAAPYEVPADNPFVGVAGEDEIWAYGLRNPWRFAFHGDDLYIGDVGQGAIEEINAVSVSSSAGANFGWRNFEGSSCTGLEGCATAGFTFPVAEYTHAEGCSVTGGRVYQGAALPHLQGHYFYGDYCSGWIRSFLLVNGVATAKMDWASSLGLVSQLTAFGEDAAGNLYVVSLGGTIYRLEAE